MFAKAWGRSAQYRRGMRAIGWLDWANRGVRALPQGVVVGEGKAFERVDALGNVARLDDDTARRLGIVFDVSVHDELG